MKQVDILEIINEIEERAVKWHTESNKLAPQSYGCGHDWGIIDCCRMIKEEIKELKD